MPAWAVALSALAEVAMVAARLASQPIHAASVFGCSSTFREPFAAAFLPPHYHHHRHCRLAFSCLINPAILTSGGLPFA